ncbi:MAG: CBS domain-containing protein [Thaumarchaeota archaeon]|nr:MAG: CBS domain-containing protein [Nitrososphaerota archaeon]
MDIFSSPISKFMTKKVITSTVSSTIKSVCKTMYDNNVGCLVIVKQTIKGIIPVGIITERDLVKIVGSMELFYPQVSIREFMSYPLISGNSAMTLSKAMDIMSKKNIRRLPIIDRKGNHEKLVGIVTEKDIINAIAKRRRDRSRS